MADLEWHVMLGTLDPMPQRSGVRPYVVVGRVEAVDETGITVTPMETDAPAPAGSPVYVSWAQVIYLAMSGPDRDGDLFDRAGRWTGEPKAQETHK